MTPKLLLLITFLSLGLCSMSQALQEVAPVMVNASADRLKRLDQFIQKYIDDKKFNGLTAVIVKDGKIVYHKGFGYFNVEQKIPMQKTHIFRIASMTKPIVSVAAMMLYEEGKFSLDDPISNFIPEFKNPVVIDRYNEKDTTYTTIPAKREIRVRDLLSQSSGIGYAQIGSSIANAIYYKNGINGGIGTPFSTLKDIIPKLAKLPLFNHPGEVNLYGLNTDVLGYFVEVVSGQSLDKFLQQRIFGPLGMNDTYFNLPASKFNRLVPLYSIQKNDELRIQDSIVPLNGNFYTQFPKMNGTYFSGGAGLSSTAYDYAIFCTMMMNGGVLNGVRILSPYTVRMMTTHQLGKATLGNVPDNHVGFGFGFGVYSKRSEAFLPLQEGSFDWGGMFASHFWIDPKSKITAVFMRNIWPSNTWEFGERVKTVVYQAMEK